jgi:DNA-binding NtrC family response regulator
MTTPATELLIGDSPPMRQARALIERFGSTNLNVLLEGPTGSGKELAAQALHAASGRKGSMVAFNVCAIPDAMFEDALFGHVRGAFSGATADHRGYLREAHGGTVFLDEVSALAPQCQAKLLRAVETRQFRPVGASADQRSDFRLVSATNVQLGTLVTAGTFREDLAHRLATAVIRLPALRERMQDLPALVAGILAQVDPSGSLSLSAGALRPLLAHGWPGNVRELRSVLERAAALASDRVIEQVDMQRALRHGSAVLELGPLRHEFSRRRVLIVLEGTAWNIEDAARELGVHRATLYRRIRRLGLTPDTDTAVGMKPPRGAESTA